MSGAVAEAVADAEQFVAHADTVGYPHMAEPFHLGSAATGDGVGAGTHLAARSARPSH